MFSIQHAGVVPDIVIMAKGLRGGLPLSAVTGRATIMDAVLEEGLTILAAALEDAYGRESKRAVA